MVIHSSILAWGTPWTKEATIHRVTKSWTQLEHLSTHVHKFHVDRGAGRATVGGVARVRHDLATDHHKFHMLKFLTPR